MIRERIERHLKALLGELPPGHEVDMVKDPANGDVASNIGFLQARSQGRSPTAIAQELAADLARQPEFARVTVGGRGFLNFTIADNWLTEGLRAAVEPDFGRSQPSTAERINVEFISANPTGPLNVVNARAGAYGAALVELLRAAGHDVAAEYYVNDSGGQVELLARSVAARVAEHKGEPWQIPEGGYPGSYMAPIARAAIEQGIAAERWGDFAQEQILAGQRRVLERLGVRFDTFVRDSAVRASNAEVLRRLAAGDFSYEKDGATWFRARNYGDSEDRVLVKSNREPTYALTDLNYHRQKFERGFDRLITVWGPDHHGDIIRLRGGLQALGFPAERLEIPIVQWTTLLRDGKKLAMSKRAGEYITVEEVLDEIGSDALKFFLLMRRASQHLEFDLTLAKQTSSENPVYYAQYSHARISSIVRFAQEKGFDPSARPADWTFRSPAERSLARMLMRYPDLVTGAARSREPHRVVYYALELAREFHAFYEQVRVVSDDRPATGFRVHLCQCTRAVMRSALSLVGVSAPERM